LQVLALDSTYQDAADLLAATEASLHGLDNHSSNGIYLEAGEDSDEAPDPLGSGNPGVELPSLSRIADGDLETPEHSAEAQPLLAGLPSRGSRRTGSVHVEQRRLGHSAAVRRYYAPTVIPIVQSKSSMVIVGAVLRKDVKEALSKLRKLSDMSQLGPVSNLRVILERLVV
jgi:hypothetical protein